MVHKKSPREPFYVCHFFLSGPASNTTFALRVFVKAIEGQGPFPSSFAPAAVMSVIEGDRAKAVGVSGKFAILSEGYAV